MLLQLYRGMAFFFGTKLLPLSYQGLKGGPAIKKQKYHKTRAAVELHRVFFSRVFFFFLNLGSLRPPPQKLIFEIYKAAIP